MTDQSNIFDQEQPATQPQSSASPQDLFADRLAEIKNEEGKQKYGNLEEALKGLKHSQDYIAQLKKMNEENERKLKELEEKQAMLKDADEVLARLNAGNQTKALDQNTTALGGPQVDEKAIETLVQKQLNELRSRDLAAQNVKQVNDALAAKFKDKAGEVLRTRAQELGTTVAELKNLAAQNPNLVLSLFGSSAQVSSSSVTTSTHHVNSKPKLPEVTKPQKSLLAGASRNEQKEFMQQLRQQSYAKFGIDN